MERTYKLKQEDLAKEVDVTSASKVGGPGGLASLVAAFREVYDTIPSTQFFELKLDSFGPYSVNYSRNGRCVIGACPTPHYPTPPPLPLTVPLTALV